MCMPTGIQKAQLLWEAYGNLEHPLAWCIPLSDGTFLSGDDVTEVLGTDNSCISGLASQLGSALSLRNALSTLPAEGNS